MQIVQVAQFGGPEVLKVVDVPEPDPGADEVSIAVEVVPVLHLDAQLRSGWGRSYFDLVTPYVPGAGVAGRVAATGPNVDRTWTGRRVVADTAAGAYAGTVVVRAEALVPVPDGVGLEEAAALLHDGRTALGLVEKIGVTAGAQVLVTSAAGGLGSLLVQLARAAGATVVGTARGQRKLDLVRGLGAEAVDHGADGWGERVRAMNGGRGPDVVFDGVGGAIGTAAFMITADGGRFSAHGAPSGDFASVDVEEARRREITLWGIEQAQHEPAEARRLTARALAEAAAGRLRPVVGQTFALARAADAHAAIESREVLGKTLLRV